MGDTPSDTFAERLRAARHGLDITQSELAHRLGVPVRMVSRWETGQTEPIGLMRDALAHAVELPHFDLFNLRDVIHALTPSMVILLMEAHREQATGGTHYSVTPSTPIEQGAVRGLAGLWLIEPNGHHGVLRLTGPGEDIRQWLRKRVS